LPLCLTKSPAWRRINCLLKHYAMTCWGSGGIAPRIINLGTRWRWMVSLMPRLPYSGTHWIGDWMGPRSGLDLVTRRKNPSP
jgi:hypothetical protein